MHEDMFEVQSCSFLCRNFLMAWDEDGSFSTIMVNDCEDRITPFGLWEFCYEVKGNGFEWECFWFGVDGL